MEYNNKEIGIIKEIINELEKFRKEIIKIDYIHNKEDFFYVMKKFRKYLVKISVWNNFETFYHSKYYKFYKTFFTDIHEYYLRSLESMQALSVMTQWIHTFDNISDFLDTDLMKESFARKWKELWSVNYKNVKNFIFAWCWPFPETMLYVYENFEIENILWLDYNHEAIYMAWEMANGLWLTSIWFKQIDAKDYDYSDADVVSIPLFVSIKDEILNKIEKDWKDSVQILVTVPKWFLNLIYEWIWEFNNRLNIVFREDLSTEFTTQEIIKLEKYNF